MNELEALLILTSLPFLGSVKIRLLIQHFGSASAALKAPFDEVSILPGFGPKIMTGWKKGIDERELDQNRRLVDRLGAEIIPFTSEKYPKRLLELSDHPILLYVQGELLPIDQQSIAVVGTRQSTIYGMEMAYKLSQELAKAGYTVVSGLARGIDTAAHQGALVGGRTIAVLGSGLASIYPTENKQLAQSIIPRGALISEFPMQTPPDRQRFPQRNRIVSGMTMGTLLIEAPLLSGAILTAERAFAQGKQVFALPGRVDQESFRGNHSFIKEKKAKLIENIQDILAHYGTHSLPFVYQSTAPSLPIPLEKEEAELLKVFPVEEVSVEDLICRYQVPIHRLNVLLMSLVLKKVVKEYPGKIYKKN